MADTGIHESKTRSSEDTLAKAPLGYSYWVWGLSFAFVIVEALISLSEGTFSKSGYKHVALPFLWHGGTWYDLFIFPYLNGLMWRHLRFQPVLTTVSALLGIAVTIYLQIAWYQGNSDIAVADWVWPDRDGGNWIQDMGFAGAMHCVFMVGEFVVLSAFVFSAVPARIVWRVTVLITIFPLFGALMPSLIVHGGIDMMAVLTTLFVLISMWTVSFLKLNGCVP